MTIKSFTRKSILGLTVSFAILAMAACGTDSTPVADIEATALPPGAESIDTGNQPDNDIPDLTIVVQNGSTSIDASALEPALSTTSSTDITELEAAGLIFKREEEKLTRDVYFTLYDQWKINIFQNIASSE